MRVLAIDTSSNVATVAVMEDELLLGEYILNHKKTHSQKIMTMIEQILSELELNVQDIDIFAAAIGPGSFTGLRIGVATVKALAHATGKPVVSVGTLEALAYNVPYAEHIIVPIMDARRDNVFTASYIWDEGFKEIGEPEAISIDECLESCGEFLDTIFVGDGVKVHREYIKEKLGDKAIFPPANALNSRASSVAALALDKAKRGETQSYLEMKPYYIRSDHGGFELKGHIIEHLKEKGIEVKDFGTYSEASVDYPDCAKPVCKAVLDGECECGILICGTGIGISMAANKFKGIRAALCGDVFSAKMSKEHNNANIICMGGRVLGRELANMIVDTYLEAEFQGGRHADRIKKIHEIETM